MIVKCWNNFNNHQYKFPYVTSYNIITASSNSHMKHTQKRKEKINGIRKVCNVAKFYVVFLHPQKYNSESYPKNIFRIDKNKKITKSEEKRKFFCNSCKLKFKAIKKLWKWINKVLKCINILITKIQ